MNDVPVFYATTHGQTRRIAERTAAVLRQAGRFSLAMDVTSPTAHAYDWRAAAGVVLMASLHAGKHQRGALEFVLRNHSQFTVLPSWFVSVSLSAASGNADERAAAERIAREFVDGLRWQPWRVSCVAGRLAYTQYSWLTRWLMRRIAQKEHGPTDTTRDHELTDWQMVDALSRAFAGQVSQAEAAKRIDGPVRGADAVSQ